MIALLFALRLHAGAPAPTNSPSPWLDLWTFQDTNGWTSDFGYAPLSFTNLAVSYSGPGNSVLISTNVEAWLQFNVYESSGATNLNIAGDGSLMFWYSPSWASASDTNDPNTTGPGVWSRFIEVGKTNGPNGWWSLYSDTNGNNLYFSAQDGLGNFTNYLFAPITFTSNSWHLIALAWTSTNTSLFVDGQCLTNGPGISVLPSTNAFTNGFTIGSDLATGLLQVNGAMNSLSTYNYALDIGGVSAEWTLDGIFYWGYSGVALGNFTNVPYSAYFANGSLDVVSGAGALQVTGTNTTSCAPASSEVWITNVSYATNATNGSLNFSFMVAGGNPDWAYDVFGTGAISMPNSNAFWSWIGQAYPCQTNVISGLTNAAAFFILGTPQDTNNIGLTDAYQLLVLHINPYTTGSIIDGIPDGWSVLQGLNANATNTNIATEDPDRDGLSNYQEYLYGTKPLVSEGLSIWVAQPSGNAGIP